DLKRLKRDSDSGRTRLPAMASPTGHLIRKWALPITAFAIVFLAALAWQLSPPPVPVVERVQQLTHDGASKPVGPAVVTDGSRIYFNEDSGVTRVIGQVAIAGSDTAPLTVPLNRPLIHDLSRSGSQLLVIPEAWSTGANLEQSLWLVPLPSGSPRPV